MLGNADAIVLHPYPGHGPVSFSMGPYLRSNAGGDQFYGVAEQIRKALGQERVISEDDRQMTFDANIRLVRPEVRVSFQEVGHQLGEIDRFQGHFAEDSLRVLERILNELVEAAGGKLDAPAVFVCFSVHRGSYPFGYQTGKGAHRSKRRPHV